MSIKESKEEAVVHMIHHKDLESDECKREVTIQGINRTVSLSSSFPNENMDFLVVKALQMFKDIKEVDR